MPTPALHYVVPEFDLHFKYKGLKSREPKQLSPASGNLILKPTIHAQAKRPRKERHPVVKRAAHITNQGGSRVRKCAEDRDNRTSSGQAQSPGDRPQEAPGLCEPLRCNRTLGAE